MASNPTTVAQHDALITELAQQGTYGGRAITQWDEYPSQVGAGITVAVQFGAGGGSRVVAIYALDDLGLSAPVAAASQVIGSAQDAVEAARIAAASPDHPEHAVTAARALAAARAAAGTGSAAVNALATAALAPLLH